MRWTRPRGEKGHGGSISSPLIATTNRQVCEISFTTRILRTIARETMRSAWRAPGGASVTRHPSASTVVTWCAAIAAIGRWRTPLGNDVTAHSIGAVKSRATSARKRKPDTRVCEGFLSSPTICRAARDTERTFPREAPRSFCNKWQFDGVFGASIIQSHCSVRCFSDKPGTRCLWKPTSFVDQHIQCRLLIGLKRRQVVSRVCFCPELYLYTVNGPAPFISLQHRKHSNWMQQKKVCYNGKSFYELQHYAQTHQAGHSHLTDKYSLPAIKVIVVSIMTCSLTIRTLHQWEASPLHVETHYRYLLLSRTFTVSLWNHRIHQRRCAILCGDTEPHPCMAKICAENSRTWISSTSA